VQQIFSFAASTNILVAPFHMSDEPKRNFAQPFTPHGVALLARSSLGKLLLWQLFVVVVVSGTFTWFLRTNYCPVIVEAIQKLPEGATLDNGKLHGVESGLFADGKFLSLSVHTDATADGGIGDVQLKFDGDFAEGCVPFAYPPEARVALGYSSSGPWWGAWQPTLLAAAGVGLAIFLYVSWSFLALTYLWPVKFLAYFADRQISAGGAWKLGSAAQLPAALFVAVAMLLYGLRAVDLIGLLILFGLHFPVGLTCWQRRFSWSVYRKAHH
jgi:hypothetical protein